MNFKDFLKLEYRISESSAKDYVGSFNGIVNRGIYKGENEITPSLNSVRCQVLIQFGIVLDPGT